MSAGRSERYTRAFSEGLRACSTEVGAYGACVKAALPDVQQGACEREFARLKTCWRAALRAALAKTR